MHSDLLLLKHKNPNRSQQAPPGWFSQVNWFFPASLAWKHLPAVRKAPPSKTSPTPLFPGRWPRTSCICFNSLSIMPCNITPRETHFTSSSSRKAWSSPLCARARWWQSPPALPPCLLCAKRPHAGNSLFRQARLQRAWGSQFLPLLTWDKCPNMEALLLPWDQWGAQPLAHTITSALAAYSICISRLQPHLLLRCLLLPDLLSPFGFQALFPFFAPAVMRGVITNKIDFAGQPAGLKRKPTFRAMEGLVAEWPAGGWCQCSARPAASFVQKVYLLSCPVQTPKAYISADEEPLMTGKLKIL